VTEAGKKVFLRLSLTSVSGDRELKPSLALGKDGQEVGKHSKSVK
jgi:hypothetical protein